MLGKIINVIANDKTYEAKAVDIAENGELVIEVNGAKRHINSGEVSVREQ